jgi:hypothetical protein
VAIPTGEVSAGDVESYLAQHEGEFEDPDTFPGRVDRRGLRRTTKLFLDLSPRIEDRAEAERQGRLHAHYAIFDVATGIKGERRWSGDPRSGVRKMSNDTDASRKSKGSKPRKPATRMFFDPRKQTPEEIADQINAEIKRRSGQKK